VEVVQVLDEEVAMFDIDTFVARCRDALGEHNRRAAVKEALAEAVAEPASVRRALPPERAEIVRLHVSPELTILKVVWAPGMSFGPHDHRMWAAIGIYSGGEDNAFYRRDGGTLAASGGTSLRAGEVALLGESTIHAVTNPTAQFAGAIHIYGGDFFATSRSEWRGDPYRERPYDVDYVIDYFEMANRVAAARDARTAAPRA
jgi:predicted metal-dependent enzyme (double-stranded beta helix superfamily)